MAEETAGQPQQNPPAQSVPAEADDVARLLKEQKLEGVDEAELAKMSPEERAALKQMLMTQPPAEKAPAPKENLKAAQDAQAALSALMPAARPRMSINYYLLLANTAAVVLVAISVIWLLSLNKSNQGSQQQVVTYIPAPARPQDQSHVQGPQTPASAPAPVAAFSLQTAQSLFAQKKYAEAMTVYRHLVDQAVGVTDPADSAVIDLVLVRLGQCQAALADPDAARRNYEAAARSWSPIVRAYACFLLADMDLRTNQPMNARMHAYQAAGACGFASDAGAIERESDMIVAWALTAKVLSFYNKELPESPAVVNLDPFASLDDTAVRRLLADGQERRAAATMGPRVQKADAVREQRRFDVTCAGASLEELLSRVAAEAENNVQWGSTQQAQRQRQIFMSCIASGEQRVYEVACGSAGLVSQFTAQDVRVYNPADSTSTQEQRDLLAVESAAAWRRLFMRYPDEKRLIHGHLSLAAMMECSGDALGAVAEYQLAAGRYPKDRLAPQAILRSAKVRMGLRDFAAARNDLANLLDNYPDCPASDEAHLSLAQASLDAGMAKEAAGAFEKLYQMETSPAVKAQACLGAGKSNFQNKQYTEASRWLARYVAAVKAPSPELLDAYCLLGKSESLRGKFAEATQAMFMALSCQPAAQKKADILLEIASLHTQRQQYAKAIGVLRELQNQKLTPAQDSQALLLTGRTLNAMGLTDDAIGTLRKGMPDVRDSQMQTAVGLELSRAYAGAGQLRDAHHLLSEMLGGLKGADAYEPSCELAEICLKLSKPEQAQSLMQSVLADEKCDPALAKRARELLAAAFAAQKDYAKTVSALAAAGREEPKKSE